MGRQSNALGFASRQRFGGTGKSEVVQADIVEESEACSNLLDHLTRNFRRSSGQ